MELLQLKYFLVTAKHQHMTHAAEALHISQPSLSQAIKRLEKELGVALFIRSGRGIYLSEAGALLVQRLEPVMKVLDEIPEELSLAAETAERTIKVNILSASEMITNMVIAYKELHPDVNFQLSQRIEEQDWDVRISTLMPDQAPQTIHSVFREEIYLAVPVDSPYASLESISLSQLRNEAFVSHDKAKPFTSLTTSWCMSCGFEPKIVFESDSPSTVRNLISTGFGVAFWPAYSWGKENSQQVKLLHITNPRCIREIYVTRQKKKPSSPIQDDFYEFLTNHLSNLANFSG